MGVSSDLSSLASYVHEAEAQTFRANIGKPLAHAVPRKLFSSFLEHMATATTGGVLAELLSNPVFAKRHYLTPHQLEVLKKNGGAIDRYWKSKDSEAFERDWSNGVLWSGFGPAIFDDETDQRIPLPWARVGDGRVTPAVGRVGHAIRLFGAADRDNSSALRQVIFPPVHRERRLLVSVVARMIGEARGKLEVSLNRPAGEPEKSPGETLASAEMLYAHGNGWKQLHAQLTLPEGVVEPREPLNFVIRWIAEDGIDVILDQVSILPFDHEAGFDPDVLAIASGQFAQLRWPGGNFASFYHWRQGVEPAIDRITVENQAWGGLDHNAIGTDEYIALCRRIGAEPHITVNAGTGSPEEAAAWVEYCNGDATTPMGSLRARNGHIEPYDVRVWEVGNELWGDFQGGNVGGHVNATRFASFASAMREASPTPSPFWPPAIGSISSTSPTRGCTTQP